MESQQRADVDVGKSVTVGQHEVLGLDEPFNALYPPARHSFLAGIDETDLPVVSGQIVEKLRRRLAKPQREVTQASFAAQEEVLDHAALVAQAQNETATAIAGVDLHDVVENRPAADLRQRLRAVLAFLVEAGPLPAAENDYRNILKRCLNAP